MNSAGILSVKACLSLMGFLMGCVYHIDSTYSSLCCDFIVNYALFFPHTGIFAYLNYHVPRTRREILETLIKGLQRLEYRGYDSAGSYLQASVALGFWLNDSCGT